MESPDPVPVANIDISEEDVEACIRVLRAIEADRSHLTRLGRDLRRELLTLAGLVARPNRHDLVRMAKAFRRAEREAVTQSVSRRRISPATMRSSRARA